MTSDTSIDQPTPGSKSRLERRLGQLLPNPQDHPTRTRVDWFHAIGPDDGI